MHVHVAARSCACKTLTTTNGHFPDSTRRGDAEAGDKNQVQVALVLYLLAREISRWELVAGLGECE